MASPLKTKMLSFRPVSLVSSQELRMEKRNIRGEELIFLPGVEIIHVSLRV